MLGRSKDVGTRSRKLDDRIRPSLETEGRGIDPVILVNRPAETPFAPDDLDPVDPLVGAQPVNERAAIGGNMRHPENP